MNASPDFWRMLVGIAFFLMAMDYLETTLQSLAGRKFKLFLKNNLKNKWKAITGSALITGIMQSSSITNLLIVSLAGSGVVQLENALSLILGANLGSTLNSWLVALLGFQYSIQSVVFPVVGISGILLFFFKKDTTRYLWLSFLFSLSFLFLSIDFIKTGMEDVVTRTDLSLYVHYPLFGYWMLGIVLTAIVQSSAATIAITLSALYANAITLPIAMAVVLGGEIGTTLKLFLAAVKGLPVKKSIAAGNFYINVLTALVVFIFLMPIHYAITNLLQIENKLLALVFFQSFINVVSIVLFAPFLHPFSLLLKSRNDKKNKVVDYISPLPITDIDAALDTLEKETRHFINEVLQYNIQSFALQKEFINEPLYAGLLANKTNEERYAEIKQLHGSLHNFYIELQTFTAAAEHESKQRVNQLSAVIRNFMYAAKNIQDAKADILQTSNSSNSIKYNFYQRTREEARQLYQQYLALLNQGTNSSAQNKLTELLTSVSKSYEKVLTYLYQEGINHQVSEMEISMMMNFNREMYTSYKSILYGLKDLLLDADEAASFNNIPGFIH